MKDDIDRLYVIRKEGRAGFASIEDWADASIHGFKDYIENNKERLIKQQF